MERVIKMLQHRLDDLNKVIASDELYFSKIKKSGNVVPEKLKTEYERNCDLMFQLMRAIQFLTKKNKEAVTTS